MQQNFRMFPLMNDLFLQSSFRPLSVLVFHLLLTHSQSQSQLIGSSQPIVATVGDDVILPCHLDPAVDVGTMILEWTRSDLKPNFVHVRRGGQDLVDKHPSYRGRTSLFINELRHGNISLKLSKVKLSDGGTYHCFIPKLDKRSSVELVVASGAASSPVISLSGTDSNRGAVVLECESKGWYPEPEVLWLDGEGNLLSAGPTETVRGPDDLYTVSSRVTVEKRHSNSFTCRVQQNKTNQTREAHIYVADDFFPSSSSSSVPAIVGVVVSLLIVLTLVFAVWKWRQNKLKNKKNCDVERPQNISDSNDPLMEPLMRNRETERETVENEEMKIHPSRETTNIHTQIKEETHQRPTDSDLQSAVEGGRPQQRGQTERETTNVQEETETLSAEGRGDDPNPTESDLEKGDKTTSVGENTNVNDKTTIHPSAQTTNPDTHIEEKTHQTPADSDLQGESPQEQGQTEGETTNGQEETETEPGEKQRDDPNPTESDLENGDKTTSVSENTNVNVDTKIHPSSETTNLHTQINEETLQRPTDSDLQSAVEGERDQILSERKTESEPGEDPNPPERESESENTVMERETLREQDEKEGEERTQTAGDETEAEKHEETETEPVNGPDTEKEKLMTKLQAKEREQRKYDERVSRKMRQKKEKETLINELKQQLQEVERQREETEKKLQSENREEDMKHLEKKKTELQKQLEKIERGRERTKNEVIHMTEQKIKVTNEKEEVMKKIKQMEKQRNENMQINETEGQSDSDDDL